MYAGTRKLQYLTVDALTREAMACCGKDNVRFAFGRQDGRARFNDQQSREQDLLYMRQK